MSKLREILALESLHHDAAEARFARVVLGSEERLTELLIITGIERSSDIAAAAIVYDHAAIEVLRAALKLNRKPQAGVIQLPAQKRARSRG